MDTVAQELSLEIRRIYHVSQARLYHAWTQAEAIARWFAPDPRMTTVVHALDVRVGGKYRIEMREPGGKAHVACGVYTEVVPDQRLAFTWSWEGQTEETLVQLDIVGGGDTSSELILRHSRFATDSSRNGHNEGWGACLARLSDAC